MTTFRRTLFALAAALIGLVAIVLPSGAVTGSRPWMQTPLDSGLAIVIDGAVQANAVMPSGDLSCATSPGSLNCTTTALNSASTIALGAGFQCVSGDTQCFLSQATAAGLGTQQRIGIYGADGGTASDGGSIVLRGGASPNYGGDVSIAGGQGAVDAGAVYLGGSSVQVTSAVTVVPNGETVNVAGSRAEVFSSTYGIEPSPMTNGLCVSPIFNAGGNIVAGIATDGSGNMYIGSDNAYSTATMPNIVTITGGSKLQFDYLTTTEMQIGSSGILLSKGVYGDGTNTGAYGLHGYTSYAVTGTATVPSTVSGGYGSRFISLTGTLTGAVTLTLGSAGGGVPPAGEEWCWENATSGAFTITLKIYSDTGPGVALSSPGVATPTKCTRTYTTGSAMRLAE